jgi:hypothetical protein
MSDPAQTGTLAPDAQQPRQRGTISAVLVGYDESTEQIRSVFESLRSQFHSPAHK